MNVDHQGEAFVRFSQLWQALDARTNAKPAFDAMVGAYREPWRVYHTLEHVLDCLMQMDSVLELAKKPLEVEMALWLHDVVYETHANDNEARSADWAKNVLSGAGVALPYIERICGLILDTKHQAVPVLPDGRLVVDIDLCILGRKRKTFVQYEHQIRQEYDWVSEQTFRRERAKILQAFLARAQLYQLPVFREQFETRARENLTWSIQALLASNKQQI